MHKQLYPNTYERFVKIPKRTSFLAQALTWLVLILSYLFLFRDTPVTLFGVLLFIIFLKVSDVCAMYVFGVCYKLCARAQIREFAGTKFDSWEDLHEWFVNADPNEIERIAMLKPDQWDLNT